VLDGLLADPCCNCGSGVGWDQASEHARHNTMIAAVNSRSAMNTPKAARAKPFPVEITVLQRRCSLCRGYDDVNKSAYPRKSPNALYQCLAR